MDLDVEVSAGHARAQHLAKSKAQRVMIAAQHLVVKFRTHLHFAGAVIAVLLSRPTDLTNAWALVPILAGLALRTWALGHLRRNTELCTSGPYAYVRHPLYLGSFVILMGYFIMTNNLYLVLAAAIVTAGIYMATVRVEERNLSAAFPEQYEAYRQAVPGLFPRSTPYAASGRKFSWQLARQNKVVLMCVLVLLVAALFEVKEDFLEYVFGIEYSVIWPLGH